jgi:hypothetical protein
VVAGKGIGGEIADEQPGKDIEAEDGQDGAAVPMRNHAPATCGNRVKTVLMTG